jgi:D-glycero-D-manno-heptose 1,7-bisphosphate phosphatase
LSSNSAKHTLPAIFLDRDGVLNRVVMRGGTVASPRSLEEFELLPDAAEFCASLKARGYLLVVATNQPDLGRGLLGREVLEAMHERLRAALPLDAIEVCGSGDDNDPRRKPNPGMLLDAAARLGIDLAGSWFVGDGIKDMRAGRAAGVRTLLLKTPYNTDAVEFAGHVAGDHAQAADIILHGRS